MKKKTSFSKREKNIHARRPARLELPTAKISRDEKKINKNNVSNSRRKERSSVFTGQHDDSLSNDVRNKKATAHKAH